MTSPTLGQQVDALTTEHAAHSRARAAQRLADRAIPSKATVNRYDVRDGVASIGETGWHRDPNEWPLEVLLEAIPGAREAWTAVEETRTAGRSAYATYRASRRAWVALRDQRRPPALSVDVERAQIASDEAERAMNRAGQASRRALETYDDLVTPKLRTDDVRRRTASATVAAHDRALKALEELKAALGDYLKGAGLVGVPLRGSTYAPTVSDAVTDRAETLLGRYQIADVRAFADAPEVSA